MGSDSKPGPPARIRLRLKEQLEKLEQQTADIELREARVKAQEEANASAEVAAGLIPPPTNMLEGQAFMWWLYPQESLRNDREALDARDLALDDIEEAAADARRQATAALEEAESLRAEARRVHEEAEAK